MDETPRSREARQAAEAALVRVVHHYGATPEFVVLGGLVPELLCAGGSFRHAGTTDVDVQVNLEIFDDAPALGAANLRGTAFAARDVELRTLRARVGDRWVTVEVRTTGLAGFLLAKTAAARSRRKPKDWYDIAFVLLHNDVGGPLPAAARVLELFAGNLASLGTALDDLAANMADVNGQGALAYAKQFCEDHPDQERESAAADAVTAVTLFLEALSSP